MALKKEKEKTSKEIKVKKNVDTKKMKKNDGKKKQESYFKKVIRELKLVKWPSFKEVLKYTASTILLCVILCLFFLLLNLGLSYVKGLFV